MTTKEPAARGGGSPREWHRLVLVGAVVGVYRAVVDGDDTDHDTDSIALQDSQMLIPTDVDGVRRILAVDVGSGDAYPVLRDGDVYLPSITHDREWMLYLQGVRGLRAPYLVQVDGSRNAPLLAPESRPDCPYSRRPTQSLDGGSIALVCLDDGGEPTGLYRVDTEGVLSPLVEDPNIIGSPTWTGDDLVIYARTDPAGGPTTLWQVPADLSESPDQVELVTTGWANSPDWSEEGLLYLDSPADGESGDVHVLTEDGRDTRLTFSGQAQWPTWSPDGSRFAFLVEDAAGGTTLWVQDAEPNAEAEQVTVEGQPGAPAWGAR